MLYSVLTDQILLGEGYRNGAHSTLHEQLVVMFEDDGETGYFYAMDLDQKDNPIVDSLFVYNVSDIEAESLKEPRRLLINGYPHAVFDFRQFVGYNHTKHPYPELGSMWVRKETTPELVEKWLR